MQGKSRITYEKSEEKKVDEVNDKGKSREELEKITRGLAARMMEKFNYFIN